MEEELKRKLRAALRVDALEECHVVYILVETRKLLGQLAESYAPADSLRFHCNWAVHTLLDRRAAQAFVRSVDDWLKAGLDGKGVPPAQHDEMQRLLYFETFREEFRGFLERCDLPTQLCDGKRWEDFLGAYRKVIADCPLSCKAADSSLTRVDEVIFAATSSETGEPSPRSTDEPWIEVRLLHQGKETGVLRLNGDGRLVGSELKVRGADGDR